MLPRKPVEPFRLFLNFLAREYASAAAPMQKPVPSTLREVQHVVAIASGKGGVGKSTTAVNIAVAMSTKLGLRVGLLDADVHGPSTPMLMNLSGRPVVEKDSMLMIPLENYRVKCMSFGFFMQGDAPAIWRGPIVNSTIDKFLKGTAWGALDVLLIDMPPGTGDAQITLSQRLPLSGAVIVTTPQDVALLDARRGARMFQQVRVPLLGLVENMSHYVCRNCGHKEHIFGEAGGETTAAEMGIDLLGKVPLDIAVRERSDSGAPIVVSDPLHPCAVGYVDIARKVHDQLKRRDVAQSSQLEIKMT